jgi:DNA-binding NtrC family response regulator
LPPLAPLAQLAGGFLRAGLHTETIMSGSPRRILFVEDDNQVRLLLEEALRDEGYAVDGVDTIAAAHAQLAAVPYDLVLTDGRLPDGTGFSVAADATERGIKVLVYTGYGLEFSEKERARYPVLAKPVRISDLLVVIRHFRGEDVGWQPRQRAPERQGNGAIIFDC